MSPPNGHHNVTIDMEGYNDDYVIDDTELVHSTMSVRNTNDKKQVPIFLFTGNKGVKYTNDELKKLIENGTVIEDAYTRKILTKIPNIGDNADFEDFKYHVGNHYPRDNIIAVHNVK